MGNISYAPCHSISHPHQVLVTRLSCLCMSETSPPPHVFPLVSFQQVFAFVSRARAVPVIIAHDIGSFCWRVNVITVWYVCIQSSNFFHIGPWLLEPACQPAYEWAVSSCARPVFHTKKKTNKLVLVLSRLVLRRSQPMQMMVFSHSPCHIFIRSLFGG